MEYNPEYVYFEPVDGLVGKWCIARDLVYDIKNILAGSDESIKERLVQIKETAADDSFPFRTTQLPCLNSNELCPWKFVYIDPAFQDMMHDEKVLEWTDLKIGDIIRSKVNRNVYMQVQGIDKRDNTDVAVGHIFAGGGWKSDYDLANWEKVED